MSNTRFIAVAGVVLAATLSHVAPLHAQQGPPPAADRRGPPPADGRRPPLADRRGPPSIDERVQRMTTELGLTADQATKVRALLTSQQRSMDTILARRTAARDAEHAAMEAMRTNMQKNVSAILTPEQRLKHDAMRARMEGGRGRGRSMRGGPGMRDDRGPRGRNDDRRGPPLERRGPPDDDQRGTDLHR